MDFDLVDGLSSIVRLSSEVPEDAFSARSLGTERQGNAILLMMRGSSSPSDIWSSMPTKSPFMQRGHDVPAELVGYNHESGICPPSRALALDVPAASIGTAEGLEEGEPVVIAPYGGADHAISAAVVSRREFAGSWEYLLDNAIFTAPIHPNWSGAALLRTDGSLCGVGSLWINDAEEGKNESPGNMFVPIDLLPPIYDAHGIHRLRARCTSSLAGHVHR